MDKLLTKNSVAAILAGLLVVAGAFWWHLTDSAELAVAPSATQLEAKAEVANLVYQNNLPTKLGAEQNIQTYDPALLAYDDLKDKGVLYGEGTRKYGAANIHTATDTNRASILTFGIALTKAIGGYPFYKGPSPTEITLNIYNNIGSADDNLLALENIRLTYDEKSSQILALTAPSDLAKVQLNLANSWNRISQLIANMEKIGTNKLLALNSARQYVEESRLVLGIFNQLNLYFKDKNIQIGNDQKVTLAVDVIN